MAADCHRAAVLDAVEAAYTVVVALAVGIVAPMQRQTGLAAVNSMQKAQDMSAAAPLALVTVAPEQ